LEIVFLIYGAAFLLLGTAIFVQPKRGSSFALSKILWLLAAFALLHGINEWLDMWKLIRGSRKALDAAGLAFLLTSFGFLLEFGRRVVLIAKPAMPTMLHRFLGWPVYATVVAGLVAGGFSGSDPWHDFGVWGRYLLGFPGALLSGLGLVLYYRSESLRLDRLGVKPYFFLGGAAFVAYGLLSGLVVPTAEYFPANWLNYDSFHAATTLPVQVFRAACAVVAAFSVAKILRIFHWEAGQQLEEALQSAQTSVKRFKDLLESTSDWVWEVNLQGVYTYVSPKIQDILGYTPEEVLGRTPFDLMPPDEAEHVRALFNTVLASQQPCYGIENTNRHKNGQVVVLETNAVPVFGQTGKLIGYRGMDRDITERSQAELALRQSENNLAEAQRISHLGSWEWSIPHGSLHWSDETYRIFGISAERFEPTYEAFLQVIHPDDRARVQHAVEAALQQQKPYDIQHRIQYPDGQERTVHERGEVLFDPVDARPLRMVGTVQDVTELKRSQQRLRQAAKVFESTSEGVMITASDQRIVAANQAFTRITGYTEDEVIGKNPKVLRSGRHGEDFYRGIWESVDTLGRWQGEIWNRRKDGAEYPEWLNISEVRDEAGAIVNYIGVFADITSIKEAQDKFAYAAHHDALTGLPNRVLFHDRLEQVLSRARRHGESVALLFVDLDRFKMVNDTLGHEAGDLLLQEVAQRLVGCMREEDTVARMGGDEFVVIQQGITQPSEAGLLATRLLRQVGQPLTLAGHDMVVGLSIGISLYPQDGEDVSALLKNADAAMYRAKELGRNGYQYYSNEMSAAGLERLELESDLHRALERGELLLHYQPQVDLRDGRIIGAEALARWQHPVRGMIPPASFIPLAEDIGLIGAIGEWALNTACADAKAWQMAGLPPLRMAVNVSGRQIGNGDVVEVVAAALKNSGLEPQFLEIEVTESVVMKDATRAISTLNAIKDLGVALAIDDFGTGYSSLSYLKRFPIDKLKIDKSFVDGLPKDPDDAAIATAIIAMAHSLKRTVIAEGVETASQRGFLRAHGCDEMQGYLFSKPLPAQQFVELLRKAHSLAVSAAA
jgi:diguanylate cyclase (GGDEF)-like protein/PAS domain S-box-containing protein